MEDSGGGAFRRAETGHLRVAPIPHRSTPQPRRSINRDGLDFFPARNQHAQARSMVIGRGPSKRGVISPKRTRARREGRVGLVAVCEILRNDGGGVGGG